jgi:hypothetical protein
MLQGTSMASPQATGAMALLLSAARQERMTKTSPAALRRAVYSSAQWNDAAPAFLQGRGQIDVPAAWALFRRGLDASVIQTTAPVCTEINRLLGRTTGTGLYIRCAAADGGQAAGSSRTYDVTLRRTTGPAASGSYGLTFRGNDGTFSVSPSSVALPLDQAVTVRITATPTAGGHSAVLDIDDSRTPGLDGSLMAVVVAGEELQAPSFELRKSGVAKRNETQRFAFTVPAGAKALQVRMSGLAAGSQTRWLAFHPYGLPEDPTSTPSCYSNFGSPVGNGCDPSVRAYADPQPGVWEILVESRRTSPLLANPFELTVQVLGAVVTPATQTLDAVTAGTPTPVEWSLRNAFAGLTATTKGGPLGSARSARPSIADGEEQTYTVEVPAGAGRFDVQLANTSDRAADLDLYVTGPSGEQSSADGDSEESVSYTDPEPGTYEIRVDAFEVPAGTTAFDYLDVFFAAALGSLDVDATPFDFPSGDTRTVRGTVTVLQAAGPGRSLSGEMRVTSETGAVLGTGEVRVGNVTAG